MTIYRGRISLYLIISITCIRYIALKMSSCSAEHLCMQYFVLSKRLLKWNLKKLTTLYKVEIVASLLGVVRMINIDVRLHLSP